MMAMKTYRVHIYPTDEQKRIIDHTFNGMRFVRNQIIAYRYESYKNSDCQQIVDVDLNELVNMYPWLSNIPKHILFQSQKDVNAEINKCIRGPFKYHAPKYHSKNANVPVSYNDHTFKHLRFRDSIWRHNTRQVNLPRIGYVDMHKSPEYNIDTFLMKQGLVLYSDFQLHHIKITRSAMGNYFATFVFIYDNGIMEYDRLQLAWGRRATTATSVVGINDIKPPSPHILCMDSDRMQFVIWKTLLCLYQHIKRTLSSITKMTYRSRRFYKSIKRLSILTERLECAKRNLIHNISNHYAIHYDTCFLTSNSILKKNVKLSELKKLFRKYLRIKFSQKGRSIMECNPVKPTIDTLEDVLFNIGCDTLNLRKVGT